MQRRQVGVPRTRGGTWRGYTPEGGGSTGRPAPIRMVGVICSLMRRSLAVSGGSRQSAGWSGEGRVRGRWFWWGHHSIFPIGHLGRRCRLPPSQPPPQGGRGKTVVSHPAPDRMPSGAQRTGGDSDNAMSRYAAPRYRQSRECRPGRNIDHMPSAALSSPCRRAGGWGVGTPAAGAYLPPPLLHRFRKRRPMQPRIYAPPGEQLSVRPLLGHAVFREHHDPVGAADG